MIEFVIVDDNGKLGQQFLTAGNVEKLRFLMREYVDPGVIISSVTTGIVAASSTISAATLSDDKLSFWVFVTVGTALDEFDVTVKVTLSDGQILNYSLGCIVRVLA